MDQHQQLPGVVPAGGPDPTLEWVRPGGGILGAVAARLGSDPRAEDLLASAMRTLRARLPRDTWEGLLDELPFSTRALLRGDEAAGVAADEDPDPVAAVARAMMLPLPRARLALRAALASLKQALPRGLVDAVASELQDDLATIWRDAR